MELENETRLRVALEREEKDRLRRMTRARLVAMCLIGVLIMFTVPFPDSLYFIGMTAILGLNGVLPWLIYRAGHTQEWIRLVSIALDFAILTFVLTYPNPTSEVVSPENLPPSIALWFGPFKYYTILLVSLAFGFRPLQVVWGGICGAVFWALGVLWLATRPGSLIVAPLPPDFDPDSPSDQAEAIVTALANPNFIDVGQRVQEIVVFLISAGILALIVQRSRQLVASQAGLERKQANLQRYFPPVTAAVLAERDTPFDQTVETNAAVLFTDIVGFSGWAEDRAPEDVIARLRLVNGLVAETVFAHDGVLDKFIGDGALATFGAISPREDDAARATACVGALITAIDELNRHMPEPVGLAIGLHYGPVVVGDMGAAQRMELAVIGDTVNVASRLETMTRALGVRAIISEEAMQAAGAVAEGFSHHGSHSVAGRHIPITVWAR